MTINERQDQIIEDFGLLDNWEDKYEYIIELGKKLETFPVDAKTPGNIIKGCQSQVWLTADVIDNGNLVFKGDSDAIIVRGLVSLLIGVLTNNKPNDIAAADLYFIDRIGMTQHLAQTRSNGLLSMVKQMKFYGLAYAAKASSEVK